MVCRHPQELYSADRIQRRVAGLAAALRDAVEPERWPHTVVVCLLNGAFVFCADLVRLLAPVAPALPVHFMKVSSYGAGTTSSGQVRIVLDCTADVQDLDVLLVDDILDSGLTLQFARDHLLARGARRVRSVVLLDKPARRQYAPEDPSTVWTGFTVSDRFVVGYGLDADQCYRALPYVASLDPLAPMPEGCDTLLFDLDGTLVDTAPDLWRTLNRVLARYGRPPVEFGAVRGLVGQGARPLLVYGFAGQTPGDADGTDPFTGALTAFFADYQVHMSDASRPFPGVEGTLMQLQREGWQLAVVSNKREELSRLLLEQLGLADLFTHIIGGDTLPQRKPEPHQLHHAMALLGTVPRRTIMVGDSCNDTLAAAAAGCHAVAVGYGYHDTGVAGPLQADYTINEFAELTTLPVPPTSRPATG